MGRAAPQPVMKPHPCGRTGARRRRNAPALRRYVHGPGVDEPLIWYEGAGVADRRWLHADRQGSIIGVSNGAGAVTPYAYGPWGEPSDWTGPRFRYTGQAAFPEAQAYHYKARVYDPAMGRFLQTDPIGQADDPNLYAYVGGDPTNQTDPTGKCPQCGVGALVGAGAGILTQAASDFANGSKFEGSNYLAAGLGGAAGGATFALTGNPYLAGAAAGGVSEGVKSIAAGNKPLAVGVKTVIGGVVGASTAGAARYTSAAGKGPVGAAMRQNPVGQRAARNEQMTNMNMGKIRNGTLPNVSANTQVKMAIGLTTQGGIAATVGGKVNDQINSKVDEKMK